MSRFNLLCNQSSLALSDGFTEVLFPVVNISISTIVFIPSLFMKTISFNSKTSLKD